MKWLAFLIILLLPLTLLAASPSEPIPADQAFQFSATAKDYQTIIGIWDIKPGYYLYRDRIHFFPLKPQQDRLGQPLWPPTNAVKDYPGFGQLSVYTGHVEIPVPILGNGNNTILIKVNYQGCSEAGFCYPPTAKTVQINLAGNYLQPTLPVTIDVAPNLTTPNNIQITSPLSTQNKISQLLTQHNLFMILIGFFIFGLLLSLTPCVLPMIPILSSIIVGQSQVKHPRAFGLSCAYVLGMAITYAIAGIVFGYLGGTVQALFQQPWIIVLFSIIFILMALSLFGFYNLQLPKKLQNTLFLLSNRQKSGTYIGAAVMGCLATLILSPCVTPPLVGVLSYISQTGNAALGGAALFVMGIGMGIPLLIIGAFSVKLLPKAGPWMNKIKNFLGVLMLAIAIWMLARILPGTVTMILWAILALGVGISIGALSTAKTVWAISKKIIGLILFIYGILLIIGAISGHTDPLRPFNHGNHPVKPPINFIAVKTVDDVKQQLQLAKSQHQPVMLDFYANWCISCKQMDEFTFSSAPVQQALTKFRLLRADVTANDAQDQALMRAFQVVAPPTILFFNNQGEEIGSGRIVGEISSVQLLKQLKSIDLR
jgi:thiol:disulfide interchange protein DsbD